MLIKIFLLYDVKYLDVYNTGKIHTFMIIQFNNNSRDVNLSHIPEQTLVFEIGLIIKKFQVFRIKHVY